MRAFKTTRIGDGHFNYFTISISNIKGIDLKNPVDIDVIPDDRLLLSFDDSDRAIKNKMTDHLPTTYEKSHIVDTLLIKYQLRTELFVLTQDRKTEDFVMYKMSEIRQLGGIPDVYYKIINSSHKLNDFNQDTTTTDKDSPVTIYEVVERAKYLHDLSENMRGDCSYWDMGSVLSMKLPKKTIRMEIAFKFMEMIDQFYDYDEDNDFYSDNIDMLFEYCEELPKDDQEFFRSLFELITEINFEEFLQKCMKKMFVADDEDHQNHPEKYPVWGWDV